MEAIARGQNRILLVMATGTGKTYTAFQIIYRLWKNGRKKRILFLADRNVLIDQTKRGDFKHFKDRMTVIKKKKIDKAFEIYLALYQGLTNYNEDKDAYKEFSRDFFDLVVVDECHRGSVAGVYVAVLNERIQYLDANGKLVTGSLKDYTKKSILQEFQSLDDFLARWNGAHKKKAVIEELESQGIIPENLMAEVKKELDVFDLICHIAWDVPALTRRERVEVVKKRNYFTKYGEKARKVIEALLEKYADEGIENIEDLAILRIEPFNQIGTPTEIVQIFGGRDLYLHVIEELEHELYAVA